jgi:hypothetical protein
LVLLEGCSTDGLSTDFALRIQLCSAAFFFLVTSITPSMLVCLPRRSEAVVWRVLGRAGAEAGCSAGSGALISPPPPTIPIPDSTEPEADALDEGADSVIVARRAAIGWARAKGSTEPREMDEEGEGEGGA